MSSVPINKLKMNVIVQNKIKEKPATTGSVTILH